MQVETEPLVAAQGLQACRLLVDRKAHQFIDQQVNSGPRQLFGDLLHLAGQQQRLLVAQLTINPGSVRPDLFDHHLAARQLAQCAAVQVSLLKGLQAQGNAQQALPDRQGAAPFDAIERHQIVGHDRKGAMSQALAVLLAARLIEHMQGQHAEQRDQHQHAQYATVDAQKDRIHQVSR